MADFKFGFRPVTDMSQVMFYAHALRLARPDLREAKRVLVAYIQPALDFPLTYRDVAGADLDAFGAQVDAAVRMGVSIEREVVSKGDFSEGALAELRTSPGDHCTYCLAKPICPSHRGALAELPPTLPPMIPDGELGDLLRKCALVKDLDIELRRRASEAIRDGRTVPGWALTPRRGTRRWADEEAAERLLRRKLGAKVCFPQKLISPPQAEKAMGKLAYRRYADKHVAMVSSGDSLTSTRGKDDDLRLRLQAALGGK